MTSGGCAALAIQHSGYGGSVNAELLGERSDPGALECQRPHGMHVRVGQSSGKALAFHLWRTTQLFVAQLTPVVTAHAAAVVRFPAPARRPRVAVRQVLDVVSEQFQVLRAVVVALAIDVVDALVLREQSAQRLFHHQPVLEDVALAVGVRMLWSEREHVALGGDMSATAEALVLVPLPVDAEASLRAVDNLPVIESRWRSGLGRLSAHYAWLRNRHSNDSTTLAPGWPNREQLINDSGAQLYRVSR